MRFSVWAPRATCVELVVDGDRWPMERVGNHGWHAVEVEVGTPVSYAFSLDGGEPLPDPRSPWQPRGVHGPSRNVDHAAFAWSDAGWRGFHLPSAVLYELHVGTFSSAGSSAGTFDGVRRRLDELVALGVDAIELMPVNAFPGRHGWGYDGVQLMAVHEPYGGPEGLKRLVDACHARGLGVLLDVVYNHIGPDGNHLPRFGPYFTERYATPWGPAMNLDGPGSDEVRAFLLENAEGWLRDYHFDGLRLDAVHALLDLSARHFLEELAERVEELSARLGRPLWLVAESDLNDPRIVRSREAGGLGMDAQWSDDFHHALHVALTGERGGYYVDFEGLEDVAKALRRAFVLDGRRSSHRGRSHGRPIGELPGHRFLGYLQNHDQVGNRAVGDRIGHGRSPGLVKIGAALVLTSPFVPMLFAGEEWAASAPFQYFADHTDAALAQAVREGRRREFAAFGWDPSTIPDPQDPATFERSKLDWTEREKPPHAEILEWYRALVALRRQWPELRDGRLERVETQVDGAARTLVVRRGSIAIAANLDDTAHELAIGPPRRLLLASDRAVAIDGAGLRLGPRSCAIAAVA